MLRSLARLFTPQATTKRQRRPRPALETLEGRWVPATLQVVNDLLTYTAGANVANNLNVSFSSGAYTFWDTAETITVVGIPGASGSGTNTVTIPASSDDLLGVSINLGNRADKLSIDSTRHAFSVKGGDGNDTIDVGAFVGGNLGAINGAVTVDGESGTDTLRINDTGSAAARTYTVTATQVAVKVGAIGGFDVNYVRTDTLAVNAGMATGGIHADLFYVRGTAAGTKTTLNGGGGEESFVVGSTANTLDDIKGQLTLNGGTDQYGDVVFFLDHGSSARSYTLRADNILARTGAALIAYSGVEGLSLNTGDFNDSVAVVATSAVTQVYLNLGDGNDRVTLGNANSLDSIGSVVTVNGQAGTDSIILNDQGDTNANVYLVNTTEVLRNGSAILNYSNAESLTLNAGSSDDEAYVQSTLATTPVTLKMGGGDDVVAIGSGSTFATITLDSIQGAVTVDGQTGSDSVTLYDLGSTPLIFNNEGTALIPVDYTITATTVSRTQVAPITYAGMEVLSVHVATAPIIFFTPFIADANDIVVKGTSAGTLLHLGTYGAYTVTVGSDSQSMDTMKGTLEIINQGSLAALVLNDQGDSNANSYTITSNSVARSGAALIYYHMLNAAPVASLTLNAGPSSDAMTVTSTSAKVPVTLNVGSGNDTVTIGTAGTTTPPLAAIASTVTVNGQAGIDTVILNDVDAGTPPVFGNFYGITGVDVTRNGLKVLAYDAAESLTLNAGSGSDFISVASTKAQTPVVVRAGLGDDVFAVGFGGAILGAVKLDGQGGTDTLDYSGYFDGVRVNLALGTATSVTNGVSNIENVTGGQGNDILVGNDSANILWGSSGRDILIGRGDADQLSGDSNDDILIGSRTAHDLSPARLEDLMREWGRTDLSGPGPSNYETRIDHLLGISPGGLNGTTTLTLSQVIDDGVADSLEGSSGLDWFFALGADFIFGLQPNERVN